MMVFIATGSLFSELMCIVVFQYAVSLDFICLCHQLLHLDGQHRWQLLHRFNREHVHSMFSGRKVTPSI